MISPETESRALRTIPALTKDDDERPATRDRERVGLRERERLTDALRALALLLTPRPCRALDLLLDLASFPELFDDRTMSGFLRRGLNL